MAIYFAAHSYKSPSLVFLLRTPGAIALYAIFMIFLSTRDSEIKETFYNNYRTVRNYWKFAVMGFVQLAAPYMLFMYALQVLNPTTAGVYMAAAPWFSILLERLPFVRISYPVPSGKVAAIAVGLVGIIIVSISGISFAANSNGYCHSAGGNQTTTEQCCTPFTNVQLAMSLLALIGGSLMWSISSVFWRSKRGNIHYVSGGIGNNIFGGIFALMLWLALQRYEDLKEVSWMDESAVFSIIFLTVISGWLAAVIVDYMYKEVGALITNRALCLVPLVAWFEEWMLVRKFKVMSVYWPIPVEVVGVVLMFVGLIISNLEPENLASTLRRPLLSSDEREASDTAQFYSNIRDIEDGMISDEEVKSTNYLRSCSTNSPQNPFPPLVEVPRQDGLLSPCE